MSIFGRKAATAQQKAQRAQMRIFVRLACCAYLIYFVIVPLIQPASEEDTMSPAVRVVAIVAFILATAAILLFTIRELVVNWKAGKFKAGAYEDDADIKAGGISADSKAGDSSGDMASDDEDYIDDDDEDDDDDDFDDEDDDDEDDDDDDLLDDDNDDFDDDDVCDSNDG